MYQLTGNPLHHMGSWSAVSGVAKAYASTLENGIASSADSEAPDPWFAISAAHWNHLGELYKNTGAQVSRDFDLIGMEGHLGTESLKKEKLLRKF